MKFERKVNDDINSVIKSECSIYLFIPLKQSHLKSVAPSQCSSPMFKIEMLTEDLYGKILKNCSPYGHLLNS